jgi:hypothetical protein
MTLLALRGYSSPNDFIRRQIRSVQFQVFTSETMPVSEMNIDVPFTGLYTAYDC